MLPTKQRYVMNSLRLLMSPSILLRLWRTLTGSTVEAPVLSRPVVSHSGSTCWSAHLELYDKALVLSGWGWTGPIRERIALSDIEAIEKWTSTAGPNFRIHSDGRADPLELRVTGAFFWERAFRDRGVTVKRRH